MRELNEVAQSPITKKQIAMHGLSEISLMPSGKHSDPAYSAIRDIKEYARRILDSAMKAPN